MKCIAQKSVDVVMFEIFDLIADGASREEAIKKAGSKMSLQEFIIHLRVNKVFRLGYEQALEEQADLYSERMVQLAEKVKKEPEMAVAYRLSTDIYKWQAEVKNNRRFGKKVHIEQEEKLIDREKLMQEIKNLSQELVEAGILKDATD